VDALVRIPEQWIDSLAARPGDRFHRGL